MNHPKSFVTQSISAFGGLLVGIITEGAKVYNKKITPEFTNEVLSCLYWSVKKNKCGKSVLRPKEVAKFKEKNWYLQEPYKSIANLNDKLYSAIVKVFKTAEKVIDKAIDTAEKVVDTGLKIVDTALDTASGAATGTLWAIRNLPYILTGGVVLFAGVQIYGKSKNGKFYGEQTARKVVKAKTGLGELSYSKMWWSRELRNQGCFTKSEIDSSVLYDVKKILKENPKYKDCQPHIKITVSLIKGIIDCCEAVAKSVWVNSTMKTSFYNAECIADYLCNNL